MRTQLLTFILLCLSSTLLGQVRGNGTITTERFDISGIEEIQINVNGELIIDASSDDNYIQITADENLISYLKPDQEGSFLELTQQKWVEASQDIQYKIVSNGLKVIKNDSWTNVKVTGLNQESIRYQSLVGADAIFEGRVVEFRLGLDSGSVDASNLRAENAIISIWDYAQATVNVISRLDATVSNDGKVIYVNEPEKIKKRLTKGGKVAALTETKKAVNSSPNRTKYIKFKIKSKDTEVIQAYVKGPKPNGGYFSYGLPIRPFIPRKENWTIGTKLFSVNKFGVKKLIYTVKAEDEGKVITVSKKQR